MSDATDRPSKQHLGHWDICKSNFWCSSGDQSSNEYNLRKNRREDVRQSSSHSFEVFLVVVGVVFFVCFCLF